MTFEEWWSAQSSDMKIDNAQYAAECAWVAAWDQQQRVIDEMHLMFREHGAIYANARPMAEVFEEYEQELINGSNR